MNIRADIPMGADLNACDREPIHIPGSIQPHGALLGVDGEGVIQAAAGRTLDFFGAEPAGLLGRQVAEVFEDPQPGAAGYVGAVWSGGHHLDLTRAQSGGLDLLEFEPIAPSRLSGMALLQALETATSSLDAARTPEDLCQRAATAFRTLTGFDRVMVYRFLEDGAGRVLGEDKVDALGSFLHHHFPASDIPRQARALYLRNLTRIIPDASYEPAPIVARGGVDAGALDLSDSVLRSVSPVHLEYLQNMGVAASASISIVMDGALWGLVALHNMTPKLLPNETRAVCRMLAGVLSRRLKAFDDVAFHAEQERLAAVRAAVVDDLDRRGDGPEGLAEHLVELIEAAGADGVALCLDGRVLTAGSTPPAARIPALRDWAVEEAGQGVFSTDRLGAEFEAAASYAAAASGLLALRLNDSGSQAILWFRPERVEEVRWAGDPHKAVPADPSARLNPRTSFEGWKETVRGRSRAWRSAEVEAAAGLRRDLRDLSRQREVHAVNARLSETLVQHQHELAQKDFLLKEVNHRIQNNLQLVASFLSLQRRETTDPAVRGHLDEAARRMRAVGLVHRRLYHSDVVEAVEMDRYLQELTQEIISSLGPEWDGLLTLDATPVSMPTDRAVAIGLVVTELVINVAKYAYEGRPGPVAVSLSTHQRELIVTVSDQGRGRGKAAPAEGFGTRMMKALVAQIGGVLSYTDNAPGARAVLAAPLA